MDPDSDDIILLDEIKPNATISIAAAAAASAEFLQEMRVFTGNIHVALAVNTLVSERSAATTKAEAVEVVAFGLISSRRNISSGSIGLAIVTQVSLLLACLTPNAMIVMCDV